MKGRANKSLCRFALAALPLGACSKAPESPVAKTNPNPKQRYEITVELVDPPQDIREISGVAHFGVGTQGPAFPTERRLPASRLAPATRRNSRLSV